MDILHSASLKNAYVLNGNLTATQHSTIAQVAAAEAAPQAANEAAVRENCQHWCKRVLQRLVAYHIVSQQTVNGLPAATLR